MTMQILLNLVIAMVWMLLHDEWNTLTFAMGFVIGLLMIFSMRRFFPTPFYGKRIWAIVKLLYLFGIELVKSSIIVIAQIIRPKIRIQPGIFKMHTSLKTEWEITMLSNLLTLTPGSVIMEVAPEEGILYVHAMDVPLFQEDIEKTKQLFEKAIREVMG